MSARLALIIGNSLFRDTTLTKLQKPEADVGALADLLLDPEVGGFDDTKLLVNMSSAAVRRGISEFFAEKQRDDLLLLYFSGHGILDDQGRLYLAVKDTDRKLLSATAIPTTFVADEMNNSRSKRQILVLDCCHSGAFSRGSKGVTGASVGTAVAFEGTGYGRVVLTASDATQYAWEGDQIIGKAENSLFTHYLIQGLQSGNADLNGDGRITVEELYDYVYQEVTKQTYLQTPGKWSYREQGEIIIAQNPLHPPVADKVITAARAEIRASITQAQLTVEPGEKEKLLAVLYNEGGSGENIQVSIGGIPPEWVSPTILTISLMPGEKKEFDFTFHPPRAPRSKAGDYDVTLKVSSQETKTAYPSTNFKLTVLPFSRFSSAMSPRKIMPSTYSTVSVENLGNFDDTFQVSVEADIGESSHRPAQSQMSVPAGGKDSIEFYAPQPQRYLLGRDKIFPLIATVRSSSGEMQTVNGEVVGKATIPIWLIPVMILLCITIVTGIIISQLGKGRNEGVVQVLPPATEVYGHATSPIENIVLTTEAPAQKAASTTAISNIIPIVTTAVSKPKPITTTSVPQPKPVETTSVPAPVQKTYLVEGCIPVDLWSSNGLGSTKSVNGQTCWDFSKWGINATSDGLSIDYYNSGGETNVQMYTNLNKGDIVEFDLRIDQLDTPVDDTLTNISFGVVPNNPISLEAGRYAVYQKESPKTGYPVFIKHRERGGYDAYVQKDGEYWRYPLGTNNHVQFELSNNGVSIYIDGYKISGPDPIGSGDAAFWIGIKVPSNGAVQASISNFEIHQ